MDIWMLEIKSYIGAIDAGHPEWREIKRRCNRPRGPEYEWDTPLVWLTVCERYMRQGR